MPGPDPKATADIAGYLRKILASIPSQIQELSSENVDALRDKLYIMRYYCIKKGFSPSIVEHIEKMLETSLSFYELLQANQSTFNYLKEMYTIRKLDLEANLLGQFEETTSGEESFRDFILESIATFLGWKSDTIWVDMAKIDHLAISRNHIIKIKDALWELIAESFNGDMTLDKVEQIDENMKALMQFISADEIPAAGRALMISNIYILLLKLNIDKMLVDMEASSKEKEVSTNE